MGKTAPDHDQEASPALRGRMWSPMPLPTPLDASPEQVREVLAPLRNDFSIALMSPGNAFAAGAIIRVAHSYLAREIFVVGAGQWYAKASMGMQKYETI